MSEPGLDALIQVSLLGLAFLLEFVAAVLITGFVAKRIRIEDATYSRALGATFLRDAGMLVGMAVLTGLLGLPEVSSALVSVVVVPVVVHRFVFETGIGRATLLWLIVSPAEAVVAGVLVGAAVRLAARLGAPLASYWQVVNPVSS